MERDLFIVPLSFFPPCCSIGHAGLRTQSSGKGLSGFFRCSSKSWREQRNWESSWCVKRRWKAWQGSYIRFTYEATIDWKSRTLFFFYLSFFHLLSTRTDLREQGGQIDGWYQLVAKSANKARSVSPSKRNTPPGQVHLRVTFEPDPLAADKAREKLLKHFPELAKDELLVESTCWRAKPYCERPSLPPIIRLQMFIQRVGSQVPEWHSLPHW